WPSRRRGGGGAFAQCLSRHADSTPCRWLTVGGLVAADTKELVPSWFGEGVMCVTGRGPRLAALQLKPLNRVRLLPGSKEILGDRQSGRERHDEVVGYFLPRAWVATFEHQGGPSPVRQVETAQAAKSRMSVVGEVMDVAQLAAHPHCEAGMDAVLFG